MSELSGQVAIVTGGASGIGAASADLLKAAGATVIVADIQDAKDTVGRFVRHDVSSERSWKALLAEVLKTDGRLDIMVNNAAISSATGLLETTEAQWEDVMRVNLTGMFYGCKRAVQQMIGQEPRDEARGRIINLGSQQGIVTCPGETPYGVSKAGAIYITRQIACDYAKDLIICNTISPGKIQTGRPGVGQDPALVENARRRTPWPRLGKPQDIANAAVFLGSNRATYITGANLVVDGGWLAR